MPVNLDTGGKRQAIATTHPLRIMPFYADDVNTK
jgi:hypothetical protein